MNKNTIKQFAIYTLGINILLLLFSSVQVYAQTNNLPLAQPLTGGVGLKCTAVTHFDILHYFIRALEVFIIAPLLIIGLLLLAKNRNDKDKYKKSKKFIYVILIILTVLVTVFFVTAIFNNNYYDSINCPNNKSILI